MREYILVCSCSGVPEKAQTSYKIMFPDKPVPEVFKGKNRITTLAESNPGTNLHSYALAFAKKNGQFAQLLVVDEFGNIKENYNLLTGKRVA